MPQVKQRKPRTKRARGSVRAAVPVNTAETYQVQITPADVAEGASYWRVASVRHLPPDENRGRHNVFVDAQDENQQRCRDAALRIGWTWAGRRPDETADPKPLDKPDNEPAGNVDIFSGQQIEVWIEGDGLPSDHVANLHAAHPDEPGPNGEIWNSQGHHSFHVIFQRTRRTADNNGHDNGLPPEPAVDKAAYVPGFDAIPDGAQFQPGQAFTQSWRLRNTGTSTWAAGYQLRWVDDQPLGSPASVPTPLCPPGAEGTVSVPFVAPTTPGAYRSVWQLYNAQGQPFGDRIWTLIAVSSPGEETDDALAPPAGEQLVIPASANDAQRVVANTWNRYGGFIRRQAVALGIDPGIALAVLVAESAGEPFGADGRMIIRFENHIFYGEWGKDHADLFNQSFRFDPNKSWQGHQWRPTPDSEWRTCHTSQATEWEVLTFARALDERAALYAISMGAPQIMGFNHATLGYATVQEMFNDFKADVRKQLGGLFNFMRVNNLVEAVRQGDFLTFATVYNGGGQPELYRDIMQRNLEAWQALQSAAGRGLAPAPAQPAPAPWTTLDPELYAAWRRQVLQGLENNQLIFNQLLTLLNRLSQSTTITVADLQAITWLSMIYNTYWTRLAYLGDPAQAQQTLADITEQAIAQLRALMKGE